MTTIFSYTFGKVTIFLKPALGLSKISDANQRTPAPAAQTQVDPHSRAVVNIYLQNLRKTMGIPRRKIWKKNCSPPSENSLLLQSNPHSNTPTLHHSKDKYFIFSIISWAKQTLYVT